MKNPPTPADFVRADDDPQVPRDRTGAWYAVSPSQIETFRLCERKLWWDKIARIPRPDGDSTFAGTALHKVAEDWLRDKKTPDLGGVVTLPSGAKFAPGARFAPGMKYLPTHEQVRPQGPPALQGVEVPVYLQTLGGSLAEEGYRYIYRGRSDFFFDLGVGDHKSTKDFKWAKSEEVLSTDPQAMIYTAKWLEGRLSTDRAKLWWIYYRTAGDPAAKRAEVEVSREHVNAEMVKLDVTATALVRRYRELKAAKDAGEDPSAVVKTAPFNAHACSAFGGCAYQGLCGLTQKERFSAAIHQMTLNSATSETINKERKGEPIMGEMGLTEKLKQIRERAAQAKGGAETPKGVGSPGASHAQTVGIGDAGAAESPPPQLSPAERIRQQQATRAGATAAINPPAIEGADPEADQEAPEAPPALPPAPPKRGPGRPPKVARPPAENPGPESSAASKPPSPPAGVGTVTSPGTKSTTAKSVGTPSPVIGASSGTSIPYAKTLFVGCFPTKGAPRLTSFSEIFAEVGPAVAEVQDPPVAHYRMIPYGAAPGALQVGIAAYLDAHPELEAICVGSDPVALDAMPALEAWADVVVVGR